jgi:hypothetical protein
MKLTIGSLVSSVACIGLSLLIVAPAFAQSDSQVGVWTLNVAKSIFSPGPAPKTATTTIVAAGAGTTVVVDQTMMDGTLRHWEITANYDGKDTAVTGNNPDADTIARTRINSNSVRTVAKKDGKVTTTQTSAVSSDGKTRTVTTTGVNAGGHKVSNVAVYEKQ